MLKKATFFEELDKIREFISNPVSEAAKRPLVYPLFQKLFPAKFKVESEAAGADIYVEGKLVVELKTSETDWLSGFYQALHYQKKGLAFPVVCVMAEKFLAVWKVNHIPEFAVILAHTANPMTAPNVMGKENAKKTNKQIANEILESAMFCITPKKFDEAKKSLRLTYEVHEFLNILKNLDSDRLQINTFNFTEKIEQMKAFFDTPMEAIHAFYEMVGYWDITSQIAENDKASTLQLVGYKGKKVSGVVTVAPRKRKDFIKFVENNYIFTNDGSGLTVDYYFSRFDEVLTKVNPEYAKQHGVFFTDDNLGKFCLWFAEQQIGTEWADNCIVIDPAAGSGNLVVGYKGKIKHKIVSDLQPDLLLTIEQRMKADPYHIETGFTIIPKTSENTGLNFLDKDQKTYIKILEKYLGEKSLKLDKPLAFLVNPPYKNTDEHEKLRADNEAEYEMNPSIFALTGEDAGKERYLAFLAQMLLICREQAQAKNAQTNAQTKVYATGNYILIFSPTSWLIPRPTYTNFRKIFDAFFEYKAGLVVTSNEFFKIGGKWPVAFTIWQYKEKLQTKDNVAAIQSFFDSLVERNAEKSFALFEQLVDNQDFTNKILMHDYLHLKGRDLVYEWEKEKAETYQLMNEKAVGVKNFVFEKQAGDIRDNLPLLLNNKGKLIRQTRYDYSYSKRKEDYGKIVSGFPLKDKKRHLELLRKCGETTGEFIGFYDDNTPVRIKQDTLNRQSNSPDRVWFLLMTAFGQVNLSQIHSGAANSRSYCAYDLESAKVLFSWFAISKAVNGRYPLWANQYDLWAIDWENIKTLAGFETLAEFQDYFYNLCFAFGLAENRCVVTKFEANNPVPNTPEIFVDNPLCPTNRESFWAKVIAPQLSPLTPEGGTASFNPPQKGGLKTPPLQMERGLGGEVIAAVTDLYTYWNKEYCKGQWIYDVGLQEEPYFKYFDYADFLTPHSGLVQIRKFAENQTDTKLGEKLALITKLSEEVKNEIFRLLVEVIGYFEGRKK